MNVSLYGEWDFADVIKLKILRPGEVILDYLDGPDVITTVLIKGKPKGQSQRGRCDDKSRGWSDVFEGRKQATAKEHTKPLETEKGKDTDSHLRTSRRNPSG